MSKIAQLCGEKGCDRPHHKFLHGRLKNYFAEDILLMKDETHEINLMDGLFLNRNTFTAVQKEHAINSMSCYLVTNAGKVPVNVILDSGSNASNIDEILIKKFNLKPISPEFIRTIRSVSNNVSHLSAKYDIELMSINGDYTRNVQAYRVENFSQRVPDWKTICSKHDHLSSLPVLKTENTISQILLGTDCAELFYSLESRMSKEGGPIANRNALGWSFLGEIENWNPEEKTIPMSKKSVGGPILKESMIHRVVTYCRVNSEGGPGVPWIIESSDSSSSYDSACKRCRLEYPLDKVEFTPPRVELPPPDTPERTEEVLVLAPELTEEVPPDSIR